MLDYLLLGQPLYTGYFDSHMEYYFTLVSRKEISAKVDFHLNPRSEPQLTSHSQRNAQKTAC
jgi:hypothetical protein